MRRRPAVAVRRSPSDLRMTAMEWIPTGAHAGAFAFVDAALDRADHLRDQPDALAGLWPRARVLLLDDDGHALADDAQRLLVVAGDTLEGMPAGAVFLGVHDRQGWFAARAEVVAIVAPHRVDLRAAAAHWPALEAG